MDFAKNAKNILIAGDSWGLGEWNGRPTHSGLEYYLEKQKHIVHNVSLASGSMYDMIDRLYVIQDMIFDGHRPDYTVPPVLQKHFTLEDARNISGGAIPYYDIVFVFVTDPHREIKDKDFWVKGYSYEDYLNRHHRIIRKYIKALDRFNETVGSIKLIGGLSKCLNRYVKNTSVTIALPSVLELIVPGTEQFEIYCEDQFHLLRNPAVAKKVDKDAFIELAEQSSIFNFYKKQPIMNPDGNHPNRNGHYKIYKFLKEKYNL